MTLLAFGTVRRRHVTGDSGWSRSRADDAVRPGGRGDPAEGIDRRRSGTRADSATGCRPGQTPSRQPRSRVCHMMGLTLAAVAGSGRCGSHGETARWGTSQVIGGGPPVPCAAARPRTCRAVAMPRPQPSLAGAGLGEESLRSGAISGSGSPATTGPGRSTLAGAVSVRSRRSRPSSRSAPVSVPSAV